MASTKYRARKGFADPSGPDFEWKYACLLFLRALNRTSKFYLATNMDGVGKFDDIVFIYNEERRTKACFMQLKHKQNTKHSVQRTSLLETTGDFSLPLLCQSYHLVLRRLPSLCADLGLTIDEDDVSVALFTNTRVEGAHGHRIRDYLMNVGGKVFSFTPQSDPDIIVYLDNFILYKAFLEELTALMDNPETRNQAEEHIGRYMEVHRNTVFGRRVERMVGSGVEENLQDLLDEVDHLDKLPNVMEFLRHFRVYHKQVAEGSMVPLILEEFNLACGTPYFERSVAFQHFLTGLKVWKNQKAEYKAFLTKNNSVWKETLVYSLSERKVQELSQLKVKFQDSALLPISRAIAYNQVVTVVSDAADCALALLKVHAALTALGVRHVLLRSSHVRARRTQLLSACSPPRAAVLVVQMDSGDDVERVVRALRQPSGRLVMVRPPLRVSKSATRSKAPIPAPAPASTPAPTPAPTPTPTRTMVPAIPLPLPLPLPVVQGSPTPSIVPSDEDDALFVVAQQERTQDQEQEQESAARAPPRRQMSFSSEDDAEGEGEVEEENTLHSCSSGRLVVARLVDELVNRATVTTRKRRSRSRRKSMSSVPRAYMCDATCRFDSEDSESDIEEKHERLLARVEKQQRTSLASNSCAVRVEATGVNEVVVRDECTLKQLRRALPLMDKRIRFQGAYVSLQQLVQADVRLPYSIGGNSLMCLFREEELVVGNGLGSVVNYYIPRVLQRNCRVSRAFLALSEPGTVFVFSGIGVNELEDIIPPGNKASHFCLAAHSQMKDYRFLSVSKGQEESCFEFISSLPEIQQVHLLHVDESKTLRWVRSNGDLKFVQHYLIENEMDQYIPEELDEKVVLVVGKPGIGKSTLLTSVAKYIKEKDKTTWVIRINLSSQTNFLDKTDDMTLSKVVSMLRSVVISDTRGNAFATRHFNHSIRESGNVVILIDGFDEVCSRYTEKALQLLNVIRETKIKQLWITSREILRETLEANLSTVAFILRGFDDSSQRKFLQKFWEPGIIETTRLEKFVQEFLKIIKISNLSSRGMQIPLETMMMAEAFQTQAEEYCLRKEADVILPTHIDLMDLYNRFVEKKYEIKVRKDGVDTTKATFVYMFKTLSREYTESHKLMALGYLFSLEELRQLNPSETHRVVRSAVLSENSSADLEKVGIVTGVVNGRPCFIHRTFAEYFAALWFSERYISNRDFLSFKLFDPDFWEMRVMFDRLLARGCELHKSVLYNDKRLLDSCLTSGLDPCQVDLGGRSALHLAAAYGSADLIEGLISSGISLDSKDHMFGWRPVQYAEKTEAWAATESLLEAGADPRDLEAARDKLQHPNFLAACAKGGHIKLLRYVVDHKMATVSTTIGVSRSTPLHIASQEGQTHIVDYLLSVGTNVNEGDRDCVTPLHLAAARGHVNVAKHLIRFGAEVNAIDTLHSSPLLMAAAEGHFQVAQVLVESGADVNLHGPLGTMPLHWAAGRGYADLVNYLIQNNADIHATDCDGMSPLHLAAVSGHLQVAEHLVRRHGNVNAVNAEGMTPLHLAAMRGHDKMVRYLSGLTRSLNEPDFKGRRPLHLAALAAHTETVQMLLMAGADLHLADNEGQLPLHLAAQSGYVDLVKYLVDIGSDINVIDNKIQTPLHYAVVEGHEDAIQFLVDAGACIVAADSKGWSPAHVAVHQGHTKILKYLLEKGADIDQVAACGRTALHMATEKGNQEMVQYLVENGADVNVMDKQGRRPVHIAVEKGLVDTANFLVAAGADTRLPNSQGGDRGAEPAPVELEDLV